jgi:hypothetical protein
MNYQYRHGTSFTVATRTLYTEGGIRRYYQGIAPALFQGLPTNVHTDSLILTMIRPDFKIRRHSSQRWYSCSAPIKPLPQRSPLANQDNICFSVVSLCRPILHNRILICSSAAAFRMILTPIDTLKTTLQAQGARGTAILRRRIKANGIGSLWWGAFATAAATFVGHYPWFATVSIHRKRINGWLTVKVQLPI